MVEVGLPICNGLQTVHHGAVVAIGGGGEHDEEENKISPPQCRILVPGDSREASSSELKGIPRPGDTHILPPCRHLEGCCGAVVDKVKCDVKARSGRACTSQWKMLGGVDKQQNGRSRM